MAKRILGEKSDKLYRTEKFEIRLTRDEFYSLLEVSKVMHRVFNEALAERQQIFNKHLAPLYATLKEVVNGDDIKDIKGKIRKAYSEHSATLFDQINALTSKRREEETFSSVPRNWQEETLDQLDGAYKSFITLRKNGDYDARPPRSQEEGFFHKIPGRYGFKIVDRKFFLSAGENRKFVFPIPDYQGERLRQAVKFKKFELYRDETDLSKRGRFWVSVAYELPAQVVTVFEPEQAVYLALGASSLGVISSVKEEVIPLWRSDKHWVLKIDEVERRMKKRLKNSSGWNKLHSARRRMQMISARQRLQDEREVVDYLLDNHGRHFVITKLIVRSKDGKLADKEKPKRGGRLGLNWAAQNTGSLSRLVLQLEEKVKERGGSVRKHKLVLDELPPGIGETNKIWIARKLRESFLKTVEIPV